MADILGYKRIGEREWLEVWSDGEEYDIFGTLLAVGLELDFLLDDLKKEIKGALPSWLKWMIR